MRETTPSLRRFSRPLHDVSAPIFCPAWASLYIKGGRAGSQDCGKAKRAQAQAFVSLSTNEARAMRAVQAVHPASHQREVLSGMGLFRPVAGLSLRIFLMSMGTLLGLPSQFLQVLFVFPDHIDR